MKTVLAVFLVLAVAAIAQTINGGANQVITGTGLTITSLATETSSVTAWETHKKYTIPYTLLTAASTVQDFPLATLPVGAIVDKIVLVEGTTFVGPTGLTAMTVSIGRGTTAPSDFMLPRMLFQAANKTNTSAGVLVSPGQFGNTYTLYAEFVNTTTASPINIGNGTTTSLTAGSLTADVWFTN